MSLQWHTVVFEELIVVELEELDFCCIWGGVDED
jgi:hypothetical protein